MEPGDWSRVARARLLVLGAGELGLLFTRRALEKGFRRIVVADRHTVRTSEAGIYGEDSVGTVNRAKALVDALGEVPGASVAYLEASPVSLDGWNYDVAVGCMLPSKERLRANSNCCRYDVVYIDGCASGTRSRMQDVFAVGPCIECIGLASCLSPAHPPERETLERLADRMAEEAVHAAANDLDGCISGILYMDANGQEDILEAGVSPNCPNHALKWRQRR